MFKKVLAVFVLGIFSFGLVGCASFRKKNDLETQGLRNQITVLESQIQSKDEEINSLREQLAKASEKQEALVSARSSKKKVVGSIKQRPSVKHVQIALKNAGYDPGKIDGRMGRQTKEAILAFQRANNLEATGKADKKTWELLRDYLYKKTK